MNQIPTTPKTHPEQQVPQWLFAFDPAGMATFRALALLAAHPQEAAAAQAEIKATAGTIAELPLLRAMVLESLRLWPTTPMILRQTTRDTVWETGILPAGSSVLIFAPFFHRDDQRVEFANRLAPELWRGERPADAWPLMPFSGGPGICPGRNLVLMITSHMLATLLEDRLVRNTPVDRLDPCQPLPATLDHFTLRFEMKPFVARS